MTTSASTTPSSFTDTCRSKLETVKKQIFPRQTFESNVLDKLELISANEITKRRFVFAYPDVSNSHSNSQGTIHGGALATWVDVVTSLAIGLCSSADDEAAAVVPMVSVSLDIHYLGALPVCQDDDKNDSEQSQGRSSNKNRTCFYFEACVSKMGRNLSFASCRITSSHQGKELVVATASHVMARAKM